MTNAEPKSLTSKSNYRADIDGLRAVAVLPVIFFHAGFEWFSGGFVGVDVFFVISGYLITSVILNELSNEAFSLIQFYERRARRILPALFFVLLVSIPFAVLWLNPKDLYQFGKSLIAVPTFSSNISFWLESGYFDTAAELKPLLHTWSLSVEEQYYILFPITMILLWRWGMTWLLTVLVLAFTLSLGVAQWGAMNEPNAAFFLLPTRAWELLIGVFAAFHLHNQLERSVSIIDQVLSILGFVLIVFAVTTFDQTTPFPGLYALVPTVGTALIILFTKKGTLLFTLLSTRPLVGVGLISYSAYLWHQPLLAFARHRVLGELSDLILLGLSALSLIMAAISWRWVEQPFRNKSLISTKIVWSSSLVASLLFIFIGIGLMKNDGFPSRFQVDLSAVKTVNQQKCHTAVETRDLDLIKSRQFCRLGDPTSGVDTFLLGDSHAGAIADQLGARFATDNRSLYAFSGGFCAPAIGFSLQRYGSDCVEEMQALYQFIVDSSDIKTVVLYAQWSNYTTGKRDYYKAQVACEFGNCVDSVALNPELFEKLLASTIDQLKLAGKRTIVIKSTPEFPHPVIPNIYKSEISGDPESFNTLDRDRYQARNHSIENIFSRLEGIEYINPETLFCDESTCQPMRGTVPLFSDTNHVTGQGAQIIVDELSTLLTQ